MEKHCKKDLNICFLWKFYIWVLFYTTSGLQFWFIYTCRINFHIINRSMIELKIATRGPKLLFLTNIIFSEEGVCSDLRSMPRPHLALIRYFAWAFYPIYLIKSPSKPKEVWNTFIIRILLCHLLFLNRKTHGPKRTIISPGTNQFSKNPIISVTSIPHCSTQTRLTQTELCWIELLILRERPNDEAAGTS